MNRPSIQSRIAAVAVALFASSSLQSSAATSAGDEFVFKGKSVSCIERFKRSNANFCRVEEDQRAAWISGTDPSIQHKEVSDILFVLNEVASTCKFEPVEMKACKTRVKAPEFGGIGIVFIKEPDGAGELQVIEILNAGPADVAGLRPGDLVVRIDNQATRSLSADKARMALRGTSSSLVELEIVSAHDSTRKVVKIRRAVVAPRQ
jgi:predicted metalloprotease with PDZ domain